MALAHGRIRRRRRRWMAQSTAVSLGVVAVGLTTGPAMARRPVSAPRCTPTALNASALLDGAVTVSPMPGAADASPQTQLSFLGVPLRVLSAASVSGSRSGVHAGKLEAYSEGDGGSFVPRAPFDPGE